MNKIDFNEINEKAQILKKIVEQREQEAEKIKNSSVFVVSISVLIALIIGASMNVFMGFVLLILTFYGFRWRKNYKVNTMYEDFEIQFPSWTPQDVLKYNMDSVEDIEFEIYKDEVFILKSDTGLEEVQYENLGYIESEISKEDLIEEAFRLKADVIANFTVDKTVSNKVASRGFSDKRIDTTTQTFYHYSGNAIKIIGKR